MHCGLVRTPGGFGTWDELEEKSHFYPKLNDTFSELQKRWIILNVCYFCKFFSQQTEIFPLTFDVWRTEVTPIAIKDRNVFPFQSFPRHIFLFRFQGVTISHEDYESLVLMKLRQAAERQKQTQQMQKEDKEEGSAGSSSFPSFASVGEVPVQRKRPPSPSQVLT